MIIEKSHSDRYTCKFSIINIDITFCNTIRRIMISEIPSIAYEFVRIYRNKTVLTEEILCNRIGLIPLLNLGTLPQYIKLDENEEIGDEKKFNIKNSIHFSLEIKNNNEDFLMVESKDIKQENVKPVFDNIPLVKIAKNQEIKL